MTLTEAAAWTKRGVIILLVIATIILLALTGYRIWHQYYLSTLPPAEEKPQMKFGDLPPLVFPPSAISSSNFSYSLDTVTGGFGDLPKMMKVYFIPRPPISLLSSEKSQKLAASLGFPKGPEILSSSEYKFTDEEGGELEIDITTGNFHFQRSLTTDSAIPADIPMPDQNQLIQELRGYLAAKNILAEELVQNGANVIYSATSRGQSIKADVSLLPPPIDNFPIVTANFNGSLVQATITKAPAEESKFIKVDYTFWPVDKSTFSTYPVRGAEEAFNDLKSGRGYVAIQPPSPNVSLSSVYLAYYQQEEYAPYLQPVFVFEGPSFTALVPAVQNPPTN